MAEEMYSVIDKVHQHHVCHSVVFKTHLKVLFILFMYFFFFFLKYILTKATHQLLVLM